jgi:hypothetical protein
MTFMGYEDYVLYVLQNSQKVTLAEEVLIE